MYLVGLLIYYKMIHGPYNIKWTQKACGLYMGKVQKSPLSAVISLYINDLSGILLLWVLRNVLLLLCSLSCRILPYLTSWCLARFLACVSSSLPSSVDEDWRPHNSALRHICPAILQHSAEVTFSPYWLGTYLWISTNSTLSIYRRQTVAFYHILLQTDSFGAISNEKDWAEI